MRVFIKVLLLNLMFVDAGFSKDQAKIYYEKGVQYTAEGKLKKAKYEYQKAVKLDPYFQPALSGLLSVNRVLSGKIDKGSVMLLYVGIDFYNSGDYQLAVEYITRSIRTNPRNPSAYINRSKAFLRLQKSRLAMNDGKKAYRIGRTHPVANLHLANMYRDSGAIQLGHGYPALGLKFNLIEIYDRALKANPGYRQAYLDRGIAFSYMRKYKKALSEFRYVIKRWPDFHMGYESIAVTYGIIKKRRKAIKYHSKAITLNPDFSGSYFNRGVANRELGHYDLALQDFNKAIDVNPKFILGYLVRAQIYHFKLKKTTKACVDMKKACKLGACKFLNQSIEKGICKAKYDIQYMKTISSILDGLNSRSGVAFSDNVNLRYIMAKVNKSVRIRSNLQRKLSQELRKHLEHHTSWISNKLTRNKPATLIHLTANKKTATALIRLGYGRRGVSFIKLKLKINDDVVSIVDWYNYSTGLYYSDFASITLALLNKYRISPKSFLSGMRMSDRNTFASVIRLIKSGQYNKALSKYKNINLRIKRKRKLLSVLLFYSRSSDFSKLYVEILADLSKYHTKDPRVKLSLMDHYEVTKNHSKAISVMEHIMKGSLKRDPMLVAKIADMYAMRGEYNKAIKLAQASRASNPGLFLSNWVLFKSHASNKNYYEAFKYARYIKTKFNYDISKENLGKSVSLRGFIDSREYKFLMP